jgi:oligosaccharide repeat unit polymerase
MLIISLIFLIILTCINYFVGGKKILHPSVVYTGIWSIQLIGLFLFSDRFIELSFIALALVVFGAIFFSIGAHLSSAYLVGGYRLIRARVVTEDLRLFWLAVILVTTCMYGQYRVFSDLTEGVDFGLSLVHVRILISIDNQDVYGLYKYGGPLALSALLILQINILNNKANRIHGVLFVYFLISSFFMAILSTGRGPVVFVFIYMSVIYVLKVGINWRVIFSGIVTILLTFIIFWIMGNAMGKSDNAADEALNEIVNYIFSSIPALSVYLEQQPLKIFEGDWGANIFRFFSAFLAFVGLAEKPGSLVQEFIAVPHQTNLYTVYYHYLKDFGLIGILIFSLIIGLFHGYVFLLGSMNKRDDFALYILAISYLPLIQTVFQETHFVSLSTWIQYTLLGFMLTKVHKKRIDTKYARYKL